MPSFLQVENISKSYGPKVLFDKISFNINEGDKIALVAPNGTGKTTLLQILAGKNKSDSGGSIKFLKDIRIAFLEQEYYFNCENTIGQQLYDGSFEQELRVNRILDELGLKPSQKMSDLSGGEVKRVAITEMLAKDAEFLIMDEPTNHLDLDGIEYLESRLKKSRCTLFMVTHDRYFLNRVCNTVMEMDRGSLYMYRGDYETFLEKRDERIANYNANTDKVRNILRRELEWMHATPCARSGKAKYRKQAFWDLKERAEDTYVSKQVSMEDLVPGTRMGTKVIDCKHLSFAYGDKVIVRDFSYNFQRYDRVGIVGSNGVGKTTFLNLLAGVGSKSGIEGGFGSGFGPGFGSGFEPGFGNKNEQIVPGAGLESGFGNKNEQIVPGAGLESGFGNRNEQNVPGAGLESGFGNKNEQIVPGAGLESGFEPGFGNKNEQNVPGAGSESGFEPGFGNKNEQNVPGAGLESGFEPGFGNKNEQIVPGAGVESGFGNTNEQIVPGVGSEGGFGNKNEQIVPGVGSEGGFGVGDGVIERGSSLKIGYYRQQGITFDEDDTVLDIVPDTALLEKFLFPRDMFNNKVARLSGGEKRRLYLLTVLMQEPNLLILDEPTNDLDIVTLNVLEEFLLDFKGSVIITTHDRHFLDRMVDHLLIFCGNGQIKDFIGGYSEYRSFMADLKDEKRREKQLSNKPLQTRVKTDSMRRLSYKEKREMEELEVRMEALNKELQELEGLLSGGGDTGCNVGSVATGGLGSGTNGGFSSGTSGGSGSRTSGGLGSGTSGDFSSGTSGGFGMTGNSDYKAIVAASARYELVKNELDETELRWLELSEIEAQR